MLWEILLFGSFWFWVVITLEGLWLLRAIKEEEGWSAGVSLLLVAAVLCLFGNVNIFVWIADNWLITLECFGGYILVGIVWSLIKWKLLCIKVRQKYHEVKTDFLKEHDSAGPDIPKTLQTEWIERLDRTYWPPKDRPLYRSIETIKDIVPRPGEYKSYLLFWLAYWPFSVLWFFLRDVVDKLFENIYRFLNGIYQSIANGTFSNMKDDISKED